MRTASGERRLRVLFVAEAVTLAHVARPVALAEGLDPARYDVTLAADPRYAPLFPGLPFAQRPIRSVPSADFLDALASGRPVYDVQVLRQYVKDELELFAGVRPDVVVGDFRLSLSVSARVAAIPYLAIANAYWSPHARVEFPMPSLPLGRRLPRPVARALFRAACPLAFAYHALPLNRLRVEYGLRPLGLDLRRVYTDGDHVLYPDVPEMVPTSGLPSHHHFLGPVYRSAGVSGLPEWWADVPADRPLVYISLGSSGRGDLLPVVLDALDDSTLFVVVATAGREYRDRLPCNARAAAYLPGDQVAASADLVVCNGGSPAVQQALAAGAPVLGLVSNMDQHLSMQAVSRLGAGQLLRAEEARAASVRAAVDRLLLDGAYTERAVALSQVLSKYRANRRFEIVLWDVTKDLAERLSLPVA